MENQHYFQQALSNFMFDVASGGAIRHLTDLDYTVEQIRKQLDFPTPYDRIQQTVWEHLLHTGVICLQEPGTGRRAEEYEYVTEYDSYGRKSFRRVVKEREDGFQEGERKAGGEEALSWKEEIFSSRAPGSLASCLAERCAANGEETAYFSCDFGLRSRREAGRYEKVLALLEDNDREYVTGLPWERRMVYHRLNRRMQRIAACLYEGGELEGVCYFLLRREKLRITIPPA